MHPGEHPSWARAHLSSIYPECSQYCTRQMDSHHFCPATSSFCYQNLSLSVRSSDPCQASECPDDPVPSYGFRVRGMTKGRDNRRQPSPVEPESVSRQEKAGSWWEVLTQRKPGWQWSQKRTGWEMARNKAPMTWFEPLDPAMPETRPILRLVSNIRQ